MKGNPKPSKPGRGNMGKGNSSPLLRQERINTLVKMRIEKLCSISTMVGFCMETWGYAQSGAYDIVKEARDHINDMMDKAGIAHIQESISELEEQRESAKRRGENKLVLEITREINKIKGYGQTSKVDITSGGEKITTVINIINPGDK